MIHLDTSFLIQSLVTGSAAETKLRTWLTSGEDIAISSIALSEFLCGPVTLDETILVEGLLGSPEPFLAADASKAAELFNSTGRRSRSLADCQTAAVALRCGRERGNDQRNGLRTISRSRAKSGLA